MHERTFFGWFKSPKRTPVMLQMEAAECGAVALGIILAYYGCHLSLEELRIACGVSRDGSKAINILKAARHYGLTARGAQVQSLAKLAEIPSPCILFWEFNHFVVLEEIKKDKVYINNPAQGPMVLNQEELDKAFTGICLVFTPNPEFKKQGKAPSFKKFALSRLTSSWATLTFILLTTLALCIPNIVFPGFSKIFIDEILIHSQYNWLPALLLAMVCFAFLQGILSTMQLGQLLRLHIKLSISAISSAFWHMLHLPLEFFNQRYAGDINQRIAANEAITGFLASGFSVSVVSLINLGLYIAVLLLLSWQITLIALTVALINLTLIFFAARRIKNTSWRFANERGRLLGLTMNGLQGIETLKASAMEDVFFQRWGGYHAKTINSQQKIALLYQRWMLPAEFILSLSQTLIIGYGTWLIMQGELTIGSLIAILFLLGKLNAPLMEFMSFCVSLQALKGDVARIEDINNASIDSRFTPKDSVDLSEAATHFSTLRVENLTFGYSPLEPPLIHELNWCIAEGKKIAVVGPTGCGKSTLAKLMTGLYCPWEGRVLLGENEIKDYTPAVLSHKICLVTQELGLFSDSIYNNLTAWREVEEAQVIAALKCVDLWQQVQQKGRFTPGSGRTRSPF